MYKNTPFMQAVIQISKKIEQQLVNKQRIEPIRVYIFGGVAVHFYTSARTSKDVDAVIIPQDIEKEVDLDIVGLYQDGEDEHVITLDKNFNTAQLLHPDYQKNAIKFYDIGAKVQLFIPTPIDLIISKIERFSEVDKTDIQALIKKMRISLDEFDEKIEDAIDYHANSDKFRDKMEKYNIEAVRT
jgi:hypothetical protein